MKISELCEKLYNFAPLTLACQWDNCGLLIGDKSCEVTKVYITLDADLYALEKAKEYGCNTVVSHHPVIFSPLCALESGTPAYEYAKNAVNVICLHTPLDIAKGGINDMLAKAIGAKKVFDYTLEGCCLARLCEVEKTPANEFIEKVKDSLGAKACDCVILKDVNRVMSVCGSGGSAIFDAKAALCDTLVTGEAKYDHFIAAKNLGINLFAFGHYETEKSALNIIYELLKNDFECIINDLDNQIERR